MTQSQANNTVCLASHAASLSSELYSVEEKCQHEATGAEISSVADELARLSTTLRHLHDAINADPTQYTEAFNEDLREITIELTLVLGEISECCAELQTADSKPSSAAWFFKKGRVSRLLKHLEAVKGTLVVMRTVLLHGKEYGTHTSERLAESNPHTMHEDRVILESVLARNRDAILDLHNLANTIGNAPVRTLERKPSKAGDHHRQLSESTGVDVPPIPDVLPPTAAEKEEADAKVTPPSSLRRTFSKREVRLGVHLSILDFSTHEAPAGLKKKWIQEAHSRQQLGNGQPGDRRGLTALPELSRISEVDTVHGSTSNLHLNQSQTQNPTDDAIPQFVERPPAGTPMRTPQVPYNTPACPSSVKISGNRLTDRPGRSSTIGSKLRGVISKLSISNLRSPTRSGSQSRDKSRASTDSSARGNVEHERSLSEEVSPRIKIATPRRDQENKPTRKPFLDSLKQMFE